MMRLVSIAWPIGSKLTDNQNNDRTMPVMWSCYLEKYSFFCYNRKQQFKAVYWPLMLAFFLVIWASFLFVRAVFPCVWALIWILTPWLGYKKKKKPTFTIRRQRVPFRCGTSVGQVKVGQTGR